MENKNITTYHHRNTPQHIGVFPCFSLLRPPSIPNERSTRATFNKLGRLGWCKITTNLELGSFIGRLHIFEASLDTIVAAARSKC